ncbi:MAG: Ppx/GppA family phosphatase [Alphaproteobacteria bacterium]|nr:Ppx/GppA family phosphatase [Alphaproteobacteria bacterium]
MTSRGRLAVIDIGSNSLRLVVYDEAARAPLPLLNEKALCALGRGLGRTGRLNPDGIASALANLGRFVALAAAVGAGRLDVIATAAVRDAADGAAFVAEVTRRCGIPVRVLDGAAEGRLSALGVLAGIPAADGLVGDLGGGSVELVPVDRGQVGEGATLPLGPLRLAEFSEDQRRLREVVDGHIASVPWLRRCRGRSLYLVGGAWRALARIHMEQMQYPLHIIQAYTIARSDAQHIFRFIGKLSRKSLEKMSSVSRRRGESVPVAAFVLSRLVEWIQPERLVFSAYGLREGLVFDLLPDAKRQEDPLIAGCRAMAQANQRFGMTGDELFDWMAPLFPEESAAQRRLRLAIALLSDMAWGGHPDYRAEEAFSRALHLPVAGIDHGERVFVATALHARYGGAGDAEIKAATRRLIGEADHAAARAIGLALRLGYTFTGGAPKVLARTRFALSQRELALTVPEGDPLWSGETVVRRLDALGRALDRHAVIRRGEGKAKPKG